MAVRLSVLVLFAAVASSVRAQAPSVSVGGDPVARIGVLDGAPEYQLHRVRAVERLSDGRIVVADASHRLRVYGPDGTYRYTIGGKGGGPGEFRGIGSVQVLEGDSILVRDSWFDRTSVFGPGGTLGRMFSFATPGEGASSARLMDYLGAGVFLLGDARGWAPAQTEPGVRREPFTAYLADRDGRILAEIGTFPGPAMLFITREIHGGPGLTVTGALFSRDTELAGHRDRVYVGDTAVPEVIAYDLEGTVVDTIDTGLPVRPVDDDAVARALATRLVGIEDANRRREMRRIYREMPHPETLPVYSRLEVDAVGLLWIREYALDPDANTVWRVYDPDGDEPAVLRFPPRFSIRYLGENVVAGVWRDDLDVEYVWVYRLER